MSDKKERPRTEVLWENWIAFTNFLYNSENQTVLGRGAKSWLKIFVFYVFYYGFLACLFAIAITIVLKSLDEHVPRYQTRIQTPGIAIQPKLPSTKVQTSEIVYSLKPGDERYGLYVKTLDEFFNAYDWNKQMDIKLYHDCSVDQPPSHKQEYGEDEIATACTFHMSKLRRCATAPYGYDTGTPCIFIKVNRIINWVPATFVDLSKAVGNDDSDAPPLKQLLSEYSIIYKPYVMYAFCYGAKEKDEKHLNGGNRRNTKYYPTENGFPVFYYPYLGRKRQPQYLSPLVAVQFTNVTRNVEINVRCKVYALNIKDNKQMGEGFFGFRLQIND